MTDSKPILVTGSHRSGSTWVGRMIALSPSIGYISEPFNLYHRPGICSAKFNYWFPYICEENDADFYEKIQQTIGFSYNLNEDIKTIKSFKDILKLFREYGNFYQYRLAKARPLLKDPIAIFSAEWLAAKFNMDVLVLIRHPAAFATSLRGQNWTFPFAHFLAQPLLMEEYLYPFEAEIVEYAHQEQDIIDQAILLWKLIYYVVAKYQKNHPDWLFIRHEDIAINPFSGFQKIYQYLNLEFSDSVTKEIAKYSSSANPTEAYNHENSLSRLLKLNLKRNSASSIFNWKNSLTGAEINKIRTKTEAVANIFYSHEDW